MATELARKKSHIKLLQQENKDQYDELVALRNDAKDHTAIVRIYLAKIDRLEAELERIKQEGL
jgi:uncharacterized protein (UPF0335 family)